MGIKDIFGKVGDALKGKVTSTGLNTALDAGERIYGMLSPAIGAGLSYRLQRNLQHDQQSWLEHMSNTAYQRQVNDLVSAGINPLYGLSGGASTPASGLASAPDMASAASMGFQNRLSSKLNAAQVRNLESTSRLQDFTAVKTGHEADIAGKELDNYDTRFAEQMRLLRNQAYAALQSGSASSAQASYYNSLKLGQDITNIGLAGQKNNEADYYRWLETHPFARWRYYNDRSGVIPGLNLSGGMHGGYSFGSLGRR